MRQFIQIPFRIIINVIGKFIDHKRRTVSRTEETAGNTVFDKWFSAPGAVTPCMIFQKIYTVTEAIGIARATRRIAIQNVVFALAVKLFVMILGLLGHASMWMAVFADSGVAMLCVLNSVRVLYRKAKR